VIFGSFCSGIEAASVAWEPLGWRCAFASEVEPFACAVLRHRFPELVNRGDVTRWKSWPATACDVLVGGTPCQSFSVAGLRAGLGDPRGNITLTYLAFADAARPRWLVWENVAGVLQVDGGRTFGAVLALLGQCGYGFAYRIFNAEYFGVPQRRRRLFVVAHLGSWQRAAAVLLERSSLCGHPAPGTEAGPDIAADAGGGVGAGREECSPDGVSGPVSRKWSKHRGGPSGDECQNLIAFNPVQITSTHNRARASPGEAVPALNAEQRAPALVDLAGGRAQDGVPRVRRLTPRECERLQGFPDDFTLVPYRGKPATDGPRYKVIGNAMPVPVMRWIGERIALVDAVA
jgi:DNA (cytosine-5)-methyltransferase 1